MESQFKFIENPAEQISNIKDFIFRIISNWKWFVLSFLITFFIAYNVNVRKEKIYGMESTIVVKEENNPFFSSNTNLVFNWGGTSDKVQTVITTFKSRTHNEIVIDKLQYYINYLQKGKYYFKDIYGQVPFYVKLDKAKGQLLNTPIKIKFINASQFIIEINFNENPSNELIHYIDNSRSKSSVRETNFTYKGIVDKPINIPFLNITIHLKPDANSYENTEYYIKFEDFNNVVSRYKSLDVSVNSKAAAVVSLQMQGSNKYRLVEYLNTTVEVLKKNQLDNNNLFATNTIKFIDSTLLEMEGQIKETEAELDNFRKNKNIFELETGGERLTQQLSELDIEKDILDRKIKYLNQNYLQIL